MNKLGFNLAIGEQNGEIDVPAGVLIDEKTDTDTILRGLATCSARPLLALVYGDRVPHGYADQLQAGCDGQGAQVEVVRLLLLAHGERAIIGGEPAGRWVRQLRRQLAEQSVISLVCRRVEVDEAAEHLPLFLAWKKRFYQQLGERCDASHARLEVVAQALGMDKRIGQGWLDHIPFHTDDDDYLEAWLRSEYQALRKKTNIERIAVWSTPSLCSRILSCEVREKEIRLYIANHEEKTNEPIEGCKHFALPEDTLEQADLLLIAAADQRIRQFDLREVSKRMRRPVVIDACSCYPLQEAEGYAIKYRTYGQNTNVWECN